MRESRSESELGGDDPALINGKVQRENRPCGEHSRSELEEEMGTAIGLDVEGGQTLGLLVQTPECALLRNWGD